MSRLQSALQGKHATAKEHTSEFPGAQAPAQDEDQAKTSSSLTVATVNSTAWQPFKKWLLSQEALPDLIALQEHKLTAQEDIDEASAFLVKQGYGSYWERATTGPKGQPVGGVAVLIATKLGSKPCPVQSSPGRVVACKVQTQHEAEIIFVSAYLHSGRGLKQMNLELLGDIASLQRREARYLLAAGDWQNQPKALGASGWTLRAGLTTHAPKKATCIMKKSSSIIDYMVTSNEIATRCSTPKVQLNKHLATHRAVMMQLETSHKHLEPRLLVAEKIPPIAASPIGPYNRPADWSTAAEKVNNAIEAAHQATAAYGTSTRAVRYAQRLHDQAYKTLVDTVEEELASKFDIIIVHPKQRAKPAQIKMIASKPMQPKGSIRLACGALPFRWLTEQGHRCFQHILQTLTKNPKKIDEETFLDYHDQLANDFPEEVTMDPKAYEMHQELLKLTEGVLTDKETGVIADTRPAALATMKLWEDKLHKAEDKVEAQDNMSAHTNWRQWAVEAASGGAGKAHRWTKIPAAWRPSTAKSAPAEHDAEPGAVLTDLQQKFEAIWKPTITPRPSPKSILFPSWLPTSACGDASEKFDVSSSDSIPLPNCVTQGGLQSATAPDDSKWSQQPWTVVRRGKRGRKPSQKQSDANRVHDEPYTCAHRPVKRLEVQQAAPAGGKTGPPDCGSLPPAGGKMGPPDFAKESSTHKLQQISAADVAEASRSFRTSTAQTFDGLHVRHWAAIEEEGQDLIAKLMCLSLALGTLPAQLCAVVAAAIPKATIGFRTIGLFPAYYRTMVRTLSPQFRQWEHNRQRTFFSFAAGKSAVLTVWAQAAHQELTSTIGKPSSATVLWDLSDFYEGISRPKLLDREIGQSFPLAPAFLSMAAYAGERIIQLNGLAVSVGYPTRGVVAGCGIATYHVQAYHGPPMQAFIDARPHLALNIHIDDICLTATALSDDLVVEQVIDGAAAMLTTIEQDLECSVSVKKADLIATSDQLRKRVGKALEQYGHNWDSPVAVNLCIDVTGGIKQWRVVDSRMCTRLKKQSNRKTRIQRLARVNRPGATKVFQQGVLPAIEYGTQVWGYSSSDLRDLQSFFLAAVAPQGKGKSRTLSLLLWDNVSWRPATAPISAYAKILWQSLTAPGIAAVPVATLVSWYRRQLADHSLAIGERFMAPYSAMIFLCKGSDGLC